MRVRNAGFAAALVIACVHNDNPDPRNPSADEISRSGYGGWIVVHRATDELSGELIAIDQTGIWIYPPSRDVLWKVRSEAVRSAEVYLWAHSLDSWRFLGGLLSISHGFWGLITLPLWLGVSSSIVNGENDAAMVRYPDKPWNQLSMWARFPQGLPANITRESLKHQDRTTSPAHHAGAVDATTMIDAGVDASQAVDAASSGD